MIVIPSVLFLCFYTFLQTKHFGKYLFFVLIFHQLNETIAKFKPGGNLILTNDVYTKWMSGLFSFRRLIEESQWEQQNLAYYYLTYISEQFEFSA